MLTMSHFDCGRTERRLKVERIEATVKLPWERGVIHQGRGIATSARAASVSAASTPVTPAAAAAAAFAPYVLPLLIPI